MDYEVSRRDILESATQGTLLEGTILLIQTGRARLYTNRFGHIIA
jgi:hypothetical protein